MITLFQVRPTTNFGSFLPPSKCQEIHHENRHSNISNRKCYCQCGADKWDSETIVSSANRNLNGSSELAFFIPSILRELRMQSLKKFSTSY